MLRSNSIPISIYDMFKVGIGPSSSHTMGPWRAALDFVEELAKREITQKVVNIKIELLGSLCKTGKGHGTDMGVEMGLCGELPDKIDPEIIPTRLKEIRGKKRILIPCISFKSETLIETSSYHPIDFNPDQDIVFVWDFTKSEFLSSQYGGKLMHPNTLFFAAKLKDGKTFQLGYHSVGGGFVERIEGGYPLRSVAKNFPYPIDSAADILAYHKKTGLTLDEIVLANELSWKSEEEIDSFLSDIKQMMISSVYHGCHKEGVLSGGLKVNRRSSHVYRNILSTLNEEIKSQESAYEPSIKFEQKSLDTWVNFIRSTGHRDFHQIVNWVIAFALAVNEENASFGRIVTAPTNGAAGVIPAVMLCHICFHESPVGFSDIKKFLLCASEIGSLFKKGSTISAAAGGCQAEIGVSASMAAAALTAVRRGSLYQILMAAEIAMEHHLGLTCDPIKGLVQVPCIERNTMGAIKAITASQLALVSDPDKNVVQLQDVIATMWSTARDMNDKYKETSEGGLATNVSVNYTEC